MKKLTLAMIFLCSFIALAIVAIIIGGILVNTGRVSNSGIFSPSRWQIHENGRENAVLAVDEAVPAEMIDTVKIDLASDKCAVYLTDSGSIEIKHYVSGMPAEMYARVEEKNGTLGISTRPNGFRPFMLFGFWNSYSLVEVYLPRSYKDALNINLSSGTLSLEDELELSELGIKISSGTIRSDDVIKASSVDMRVMSGNLRLTGGLEAEDYSIDVSSGNVTVDELKGSGGINISSGDIRLSGVDITEHLSAKVSSGTINIGIKGDPGLQFSGHKTSGTIRTYFGNFGDNNDFSAVVGDAPYKNLDVRVTSGTIRITQD